MNDGIPPRDPSLGDFDINTLQVSILDIFTHLNYDVTCPVFSVQSNLLVPCLKY